ncbi:MAG: translocation protein TolB [Planctomycetes bacterium ADurb.Bin126]|nr:MAG: translocation protein TolB [Planctomycetes bacterium ADurb.Bin126]HOD82646.1 TIR domain-containing protein [Phycisphaerae bacterium]HQL75338.1 TIR domain-containing protein [Phycisphaerae bacterium]
MTAETFDYDVFLSHSSRDKTIVRPLAKRLRADGLKVWLDEWEIKPGDHVLAKIEEGLERSRVLVLCMSANAFGSDWSQLEAGTFRFRDPLNKARRFIPLRLDDASPKGSLGQFLYVDWRPAGGEQEYARLLDACRPPAPPEGATDKQEASLAVSLKGHTDNVWSFSWSPDGRLALTGSFDKTVRVWEVESGRFLRMLDGHAQRVRSVAWSPDGRLALSGSLDATVRVWDVESGRWLRVLGGRTIGVWSVAWSPDGRRALSGADDKTVRVWDVKSVCCLWVLEGHTDEVNSVGWSPNGRLALSGSADNTVRVWDVESGRCLRVLEGHTGGVWGVAWSPNERLALSGSADNTVRVWEVESGRCLRVLEGHTGAVNSVAWRPDGRFALSGADDRSVRVWEVESGRCLRVLEGHESRVRTVAWSANGRRAFSGDVKGGMRVWDLGQLDNEAPAAAGAEADNFLYTNAKVLLVGESGTGKTGLSRRLTSNTWQPSDSTVGAWATQWKLDVTPGSAKPAGGKPGPVTEREIWLWDFGGQADQRLIHQLYMDETALAVLVFDGQKEDLFETLGQWDRDLTRATRKKFAKLLVAGRVDAGGLRVSRGEIEKFAAERNFRTFIQTSAKMDQGCRELKKAILDGIDWDAIPCRTTKALFKRLKDEIVRLKDQGRVLMRFNELRDTL